MAGRVTDRKGKSAKPPVSDITESLATFSLPDSLPCSEVDIPVIKRKKTSPNWSVILEERNRKITEIEAFEQNKRELVPKSPFLKTECDYIQNEVFTHLLPALEETLYKAKIWDVLQKEKSFFNGIDNISQFLWNNNPRYPNRQYNKLHLFNMPWVRQHLKEHPRPFYPKSWLWPKEYAATLIQKSVRQYFVQKDEEVQEMREFWKKLKTESNVPDIQTNPYLAKKFASQQNVRKT